MKKSISILTIAILVTMAACKKDESATPDGNSIIDQTEKLLTLKSGERIYREENGNAYVSVKFDHETLLHRYAVLLEEGKKYNISIHGDYCGDISLSLLNAQMDTLFYGEQGDIGFTRKYIVWESTLTDTLMVSAAYTGDINFHTYEYQITFEELTTHEINVNGISFHCSGDWFITPDQYLGLVCHNSSFCKWAKVDDNSLYNYELSFDVGLESGIPDIYTGLAYFAGGEIHDMTNMPRPCDEFKILGPSGWERWFWRGGVGREWGNTSESLNSGEGAFNHMSIRTYNDSVFLSVNDEITIQDRNLDLMDNGLFLVVDDKKKDTVYFKDIQLVK